MTAGEQGIRVVVAGGGIGGLAAATALARTGHDVTVVERAERIVDVGSGLVVSPNGMKAADAVDPELGRRIRAGGSVAGPDRVRPLLTADGRQLSAEPVGRLAERHGAPQVSLLRSTLQSALLDAATGAGVSVRTGIGVTGHRQVPDGVSVELADGSVLGADVLVGADGLRSVVRSGLLGDTPPRYSGYTSVRGRCPAGSEFPHGFVASGRGAQLFVAPVDDARLYWTAKITARAGEWPGRPPARALQDVLDLLTGWAPALRRVVAEADPADVTVTDIHDRDPDPRWTDGSAVLIGDAAHPMVPAMGQGANIALEDAVVLADALSGGTPAPDGLRAFVERRAPRATAVVLGSRRQGERDQGAGVVRALVRDAVMRLRRRKDSGVTGLFDWEPPSPQPSRTAVTRSTGGHDR